MTALRLRWFLPWTYIRTSGETCGSVEVQMYEQEKCILGYVMLLPGSAFDSFALRKPLMDKGQTQKEMMLAIGIKKSTLAQSLHPFPCTASDDSLPNPFSPILTAQCTSPRIRRLALTRKATTVIRGAGFRGSRCRPLMFTIQRQHRHTQNKAQIRSDNNAQEVECSGCGGKEQSNTRSSSSAGSACSTLDRRLG